MIQILIVANSPSENTRALMNAVEQGINDAGCDNIVYRKKSAIDATPEDVLWANGIIVGTTENFGYMSGLIKDFFERIYYPCLEKTQGLPYALYVKGGLDGEGAKTSVERIVTGLKWKPVCPAVVLRGEFEPAFAERCNELGLRMAVGLDAGIY